MNIEENRESILSLLEEMTKLNEEQQSFIADMYQELEQNSQELEQCRGELEQELLILLDSLTSCVAASFAREYCRFPSQKAIYSSRQGDFL